MASAEEHPWHPGIGNPVDLRKERYKHQDPDDDYERALKESEDGARKPVEATQAEEPQGFGQQTTQDGK